MKSAATKDNGAAAVDAALNYAAYAADWKLATAGEDMWASKFGKVSKGDALLGKKETETRPFACMRILAAEVIHLRVLISAHTGNPSFSSALGGTTKPEEINVRLFDLVRYMRSELHAADLISDDEYSWLCHGTTLAKGNGSPSPRRLEDYDEMRRRLAALEKPN